LLEKPLKNETESFKIVNHYLRILSHKNTSVQWKHLSCSILHQGSGNVSCKVFMAWKIGTIAIKSQYGRREKHKDVSNKEPLVFMYYVCHKSMVSQISLHLSKKINNQSSKKQTYMPW